MNYRNRVRVNPALTHPTAPVRWAGKHMHAGKHSYILESICFTYIQRNVQRYKNYPTMLILIDINVGQHSNRAKAQKKD